MLNKYVPGAVIKGCNGFCCNNYSLVKEEHLMMTNDRISLLTHIFVNALEIMYNICMYECTHMFNDSLDDGSHWWYLYDTFIKHIELNIVLLYMWHRLANKTSAQPTMPSRSELSFYVIHPINSPELCIESRTLATHSSITIRL